MYDKSGIILLSKLMLSYHCINGDFSFQRGFSVTAFFPQITWRSITQPIFTQNGLNNVNPGKEVPFGVKTKTVFKR